MATTASRLLPSLPLLRAFARARGHRLYRRYRQSHAPPGDDRRHHLRGRRDRLRRLHRRWRLRVAGKTTPAPGCAVDSAGDIFIADSGNNAIRMVTPDGNIATVAGNGNPGFSGDGGPAIQALLQTPYAVAVDSQGNVYVADTGNNRIRRLSVTQQLVTQISQPIGWANAASLQTGPVAPGSIISIFGSGLGPLTALTSTLPVLHDPCERSWVEPRSSSTTRRRRSRTFRTARSMPKSLSRPLGQVSSNIIVQR